MTRRPATWILLLSLASACSDPPVYEPVIRPVRSVVVSKSALGRERSFTGVARAGTESTLSFRVAGTIRALHVKVGDRVRAGAPIAELDPADYRLQVQQAEASLAQARAERRNARAQYDRVRALYENSNASRSDLDTARAASESTSAAVASAAKRLELARRQLDYTRLTAPVDGAIATVSAEVNENVAAGSPVAVLASAGSLEVEVGIPEVLISQVSEGDAVALRFDALPERSFEGRVSEVGVEANASASVFPVRIRVAENSPELRAGMTVSVSFRFATTDRAGFVVPTVSVGEDAAGRYVFVVEAEDGSEFATVHRRAVVPGAISDAGIEILDGLSEGETVVTAGVRRIRDGQRVRHPARSE